MGGQLRKYLAKPEFSILLILVAMLILTAVLQRNFFEPKSLNRTLNAFTPLILLAMGQAVVIISGGLDLSAGTALSLLTCVLTSVMHKASPAPGVYAIAAAFAVAIVIGVVNGIGMGYLRIPSVIATFATSYIWLGAALFLRPTPGGESVPWFKVFYDVKALRRRAARPQGLRFRRALGPDPGAGGLPLLAGPVQDPDGPVHLRRRAATIRAPTRAASTPRGSSSRPA